MKNVEKHKILVDEFFKQFVLLKEKVHLLYAFDLHELYETSEGELFYSILWDSVIISMTCLIDESRDSVSVIKLLKQYCDKNDQLICNDKIFCFARTKLKDFKIDKNGRNWSKPVGIIAKLRILRNKLGRAHFDEQVMTNKSKEQQIYDENKFSISEIRYFCDLLEGAIESISDLFDKPTRNYSNSGTPRASELINRFK